MNTRTTPISYAVLSTTFPSLFSLAGGKRIYGMNGASNTVTQYLPRPVAGTVLRFLALNVTNSVSVKCSTNSPLEVSGVLQYSGTITLAAVGDVFEVESNAAGTAWHQVQKGSVTVVP